MFIVFVNENEEAVVERFGKYHRTLSAGVHFLIPFAERIRGIEDPYNHKKFWNHGKIKLTSGVFEFPKDDRTFYAKDKSKLKLKCMITYQILDSYKAVYEIAYLFDAINQLAGSVIQHRLVEAPDEADNFEFLQKIIPELSDFCTNYTKDWGVKIHKFQLKQITDNNGIRHNF